MALVLFVLPLGCSSNDLGDPPAHDFLTNAPRATDEANGELESGEGPADRQGPSEQAATRASTVWSGAVATVPQVAFGSQPPECRFRVGFHDVKVELTLDAVGNVAASKVSALVVESTADGCKPIPAHVHTYRFRSPDAGSADSAIRLVADTTNQPIAELILTRGVPTGRGLPIALRAHRIDYGPPYDWTVSFDVGLTPRSP